LNLASLLTGVAAQTYDTVRIESEVLPPFDITVASLVAPGGGAGKALSDYARVRVTLKGPAGELALPTPSAPRPGAWVFKGAPVLLVVLAGVFFLGRASA
jgi:hypothetical protein